MEKLLYYYATINLILYLAFYFQCINAGQCIRPLIYEKKSGKTDPTEYLASCDKNIQTLRECNAAMRVFWSWKQLSAVDQTEDKKPKGCYYDNMKNKLYLNNIAKAMTASPGVGARGQN